jgi:predicted metal-dependent hydrolase
MAFLTRIFKTGMPSESENITIQGIEMVLVRKDITRIHIRIFPGSGLVRISVPRYTVKSEIHRVVLEKLSWIQTKQSALRTQSRDASRSGDIRHFEGKPYRLEVVEGAARQSVTRSEDGILRLAVRRGSTAESRERALDAWYRLRLEEAIPPLLKKWEAVMKVKSSGWNIRRMRSRWGSCNPRTRRIILNLELIKRRSDCLEYVVVHELAHLLEASHNARFKKILDTFLPEWRAIRRSLRE